MKINLFKQIFCYVVIITLCCTVKLYAQENTFPIQSSSGLFVNGYIYPASLILSAIVAGDQNDNDDETNNSAEKTEKNGTYFTNLYFGFEVGGLNFFSFIVTPSYQGWNYRREGYEDKGKLNHDRIGSDFGFRLYLFGNQNKDGLFLQATGGIYYFRREIKYLDDPIKTAYYKATLYQGMGYLGYQFGITNFIIGVGYNYYKDKKLIFQYKD